MKVIEMKVLWLKVAGLVIVGMSVCAARGACRGGPGEPECDGGTAVAREDVAGACSFVDRYPRQYVSYYTDVAPTIDGRPDEKLWSEVGWSQPFVDIRGDDYKPQPRFQTQFKARWDPQFLYVAARVQEPQIWANITEDNQVIFKDNDFEIFVDPASSSHYYKELEINANAATWALCLNKPYANGGYENSSRVYPGKGWGFSGDARFAVHVDGTLNVPSEENRGWTVEIRLPLADLMYNNTEKKPTVGTLWRINFSRVEWQVRAVGGHFEKVPNAVEDNWVWSPQGEVAMHLPERWGFLQFADSEVNGTGLKSDPHWTLRTMAALLYSAQEGYKEANGKFAGTVVQLAPFDPTKQLAKGKCCEPPHITLAADAGGYSALLMSISGAFEAIISDDRLLVIRPASARTQAV